MRKEQDFRQYYDIIKKLGEGGFGTVYEAKLKNTEELRAIKVIDKKKIIDIFRNENLREPNEEDIKNYKNGFYNEIECMKLVEGKNKENINAVKFYEYFDNENEFCIVMELCDDNLFQLLCKKKENEGFTIDEIYDILNQLNNTFRILYENKLVHRDIKLQNILFKYKNKEKAKYIFKLTDFGISKHLLSSTKRLSTKIGTFNMMAPEILEGKPYNEKCDIWSLGIIIYLLYFHKYPYNGNNEFAILKQIKNLNQKILKKTNNLDFDDLISKLLNSNPNKRITWDKYFEHPFFNKTRIKSKTTEKEEKKEKEKVEEKKDYTLKVILLGDSAHDKTSIAIKFVSNKFELNRDNLFLGCDFVSKILEFPDLGSSITFKIWDTAGEERFISLCNICYQVANVIIFVYDITCKDSFDSIKKRWYNAVKYNSKENRILAVVANKIELFEEEEVSLEEGANYAKEIGAIFQPINSKSDSDPNELFYKIGKTYLTGKKLIEEPEKKLSEEKEKYFRERKEKKLREETEKKLREEKEKLIKDKKDSKKDCILI